MSVKAHLFEGKKFVWDGEDYEDKAKADEAAEKYRDNGFDVESCIEDGKVQLYTRRVASEALPSQ